MMTLKAAEFGVPRYGRLRIDMSTAAAPRAITVSDCLLRRKAVDDAVADLRLEGLAPTADAQLFFEQFVQGNLTEEQLVTAVLAR
jgi:hypothetical protein